MTLPVRLKVYFQIMSKWPTAFIVFLLSISSVFCLSGCLNSTAQKSDKVSFKDEKSMREALKGTWILKEYEDSIDAGLTPKLLEYMLEGLYSIKYSSDTDCHFISGLGGRVLTTDYDKALGDERCSIGILTSSGQIVFTKSDSKKSDSAMLIIDGADTILKIRDTVDRYFVKYDGSKCDNIDVYNHLVNSKFIAGKYYREEDKDKAKHIIFTKCGNIEGAINIDGSLDGMDGYFVTIANSSLGLDVMKFAGSGHNYNSDRRFHWEVVVDSLILKPEKATRRIVLVKSQ